MKPVWTQAEMLGATAEKGSSPSPFLPMAMEYTWELPSNLSESDLPATDIRHLGHVSAVMIRTARRERPEIVHAPACIGRGPSIASPARGVVPCSNGEH